MLGGMISRRKAIAIGVTVMLAGCKVVPEAAPPVVTPTPEPSATTLPGDTDRHRVALLVPMSGSNAEVGMALANAANMAVLDTKAENIRITTYDTSQGAGAAAAKAIADGNKLILGPLLAENIPAVLAQARPANVPLLSFSNDTSAAASDVFVMGIAPDASIQRTVAYAQQTGSRRYAILFPNGAYGTRAEAAFNSSVRAAGGSIVAREAYDRGNTSIVSAAQRLRNRGGFDTLLIADGARLANMGANAIKPATATSPRLLGTELWSREASIAANGTMRGALFATVSDSRFDQYADAYRSRFGDSPHRISTLGYDAVLLTVRLTRDWKLGSPLAPSHFIQSTAFVGVDGPFRFGANGVIIRSFEVRRVEADGVSVVSEAPSNL